MWKAGIKDCYWTLDTPSKHKRCCDVLTPSKEPPISPKDLATTFVLAQRETNMRLSTSICPSSGMGKLFSSRAAFES